MKVLNLRCAHGHGFEGWFASEDDYQSQQTRGLVECPLCADKAIERLPSAPRLNFGKAEPRVETRAERLGEAAASAPCHAATPEAEQVQALFMKAVRHVMVNTEDVGERFTEEARRIHYGESQRRGIRGQASEAQRHELAEEGIEVFAMPVPAALKEPLQ